MNIDELKIKQGNVELVGVVIDKQEPRDWGSGAKTGKVCNTILKDDTGAVALTLWNEDVEKVKLGDKVKISNAYCGEYNGEKQVSTGKLGKIEVIGHEDIKPMEKAPPKEETEQVDVEEEKIEEDELDSLEEEGDDPDAKKY